MARPGAHIGEGEEAWAKVAPSRASWRRVGIPATSEAAVSSMTRKVTFAAAAGAAQVATEATRRVRASTARTGIVCVANLVIEMKSRTLCFAVVTCLITKAFLHATV